MGAFGGHRVLVLGVALRKDVSELHLSLELRNKGSHSAAFK